MEGEERKEREEREERRKKDEQKEGTNKKEVATQAGSDLKKRRVQEESEWAVATTWKKSRKVKPG